MHGLAGHREAVLLAVVAVLLGRVTQQEQFVVEVPPGRAIRFVVNDNMEFDDLLAHTQKGLAGQAQADSCMETSGLPDSSQNAPQHGLRLGFAFAPEGSPPAANLGEAYGLFCAVGEQGNGFALRFAYDPQQVGAETAQDWLTYYGRFLEGITEGIA